MHRHRRTAVPPAFCRSFFAAPSAPSFFTALRTLLARRRPFPAFRFALPGLCRAGRRLLLVLLLPLLWVSPALAALHEPIRVGVLAFRTLEQTEQRWAPLAAYLAQHVPGHRFAIVPLFQDELGNATKQADIDFILTQPEHYVRLRSQYGLAALATLMPLANDHPVTQFGGVIFSRSDAQGINQLSDLRGKRIAAVQEQSLGAYRMQQWTLRKAGVELPEEAAEMIFTGQPQDKVLTAVLEGKADAGFVRTGTLEALAGEGKLDLQRLKVINRQPSDVYPQLLSTDLYPEWPLAGLRHVPEPISKAVTMALLELPPTHEVARKGEFYGFSPPADYSPLEAMLLRLRVHPDSGQQDFGLRDIAQKYSVPLIALLAVLLSLALAFVFNLSRANRRIARNLSERASLLDSIGDGIYGVDMQGRCTFINPNALQMLGFAENEVLGQDQHALFHHHTYGGAVYPASECPIFLTLRDGKRRSQEDWFIRKDGSYLPIHITVTPVRNDSITVGAVVAFRDISEARRAQDEMRIAAIAFETQEAITITDANSRILRVNKAFTQVTGYLPEEVVGQSPAVLKSGKHDESFYIALWQELSAKGSWQGEIWNRRKNGEIYPEWLTITAVRNPQGQATHYVASFLDITQRKLAEEQIQFLAYYDPLTRLPNRRLLLDRLHKAQTASARHQRHCALLFIDLDNFKTLNDTLGHDMGDRYLQEVAQRLQDVLRDNDTLARLGGDEFVIILEDLNPEARTAAVETERVGESLLNVLNQAYQLGSREYHSTASIGATCFLGHQQTVDDLLKSADLAMYQAKTGGKNAIRFFDPAMQAEVEHRAMLEHQLRQAIEREEFVLHFQPQVDADAHIIGTEALVRWQHPLRGMVPPGEFIPLAEETGLIVPIGSWVLRESCKQVAAWLKRPNTEHLTVAVNVSALQFRCPEFVDEVAALLEQHHIPGNRLKLEITESLLLDEIDTTIGRLQALKELGITLSLDDFGTGYSSLTYLKRLPLDQLKIDRSFVTDVLTDPNDAAIARTVIALGQTFGLTVIAEGVETQEQRDFLVESGCRTFQGYLYGRPAPAEKVTQEARAPITPQAESGA